MEKRKKGKKRSWRWVLYVVVAVPCVSVAMVAAMRKGPVPGTMMMLHREIHMWLDDEPIRRDYQWVEYEKINTTLVKAVIASEDNLFKKHNGFSKKSIEKAWHERQANGYVKHGGSTISQQTAKNIYNRTL